MAHNGRIDQLVSSVIRHLRPSDIHYLLTERVASSPESIRLSYTHSHQLAAAVRKFRLFFNSRRLSDRSREVVNDQFDPLDDLTTPCRDKCI